MTTARETGSKQEPYRLAIVGVGQISIQSHIPAALGLPGVELVGLVDPASERAAAAARDFGVTLAVARDLGELAGKLDGVVVATPNHTHADLACRALEAGLDVMVEKPLATNVEQGRRVLEAARQSNRTLAVGYCTRFRDNVLTTAQLLRDGFFGRVRGFAYQYGTVGGWGTFSGYHLDRKATGGGVVMVSGTHFIDRMLHLFGYPDAFSYEDDAIEGPETHAVAHLTYEGAGDGEGFKGVARFSKLVALEGGLVIDTDKGRVILRENDDSPATLRPHENPEVEEVLFHRKPVYPPGMNVFQRQLHDFVEASRGASAPMVSGEQALESLRLIEALYAARTPISGCWDHPPAAKEQRA